jgi:hypothetical protein
MATKKTTVKKSAKPAAKKKAAAKKAAAKKAAAPKAPKEKGEPKPAAPRHPKARVTARHTSKEALAKTLAASIARDDEDTDVIANRLEKASNTQLLRLQHVVETVKEKFGSREKLIAAIGAAENKAKDKDYLAKLDTFSLPQLLDLATSAQRHARA